MFTEKNIERYFLRLPPDDDEDYEFAFKLILTPDSMAKKEISLRYQKRILKKTKSLAYYYRHFLQVKENKNVPAQFKKAISTIMNTEIDEFRKILPT